MRQAVQGSTQPQGGRQSPIVCTDTLEYGSAQIRFHQAHIDAGHFGRFPRVYLICAGFMFLHSFIIRRFARKSAAFGLIQSAVLRSARAAREESVGLMHGLCNKGVLEV